MRAILYLSYLCLGACAIGAADQESTTGDRGPYIQTSNLEFDIDVRMVYTPGLTYADDSRNIDGQVEIYISRADNQHGLRIGDGDSLVAYRDGAEIRVDHIAETYCAKHIFIIPSHCHYIYRYIIDLEPATVVTQLLLVYTRRAGERIDTNIAIPAAPAFAEPREDTPVHLRSEELNIVVHNPYPDESMTVGVGSECFALPSPITFEPWQDSFVLDTSAVPIEDSCASLAPPYILFLNYEKELRFNLNNGFAPTSVVHSFTRTNIQVPMYAD